MKYHKIITNYFKNYYLVYHRILRIILQFIEITHRPGSIHRQCKIREQTLIQWLTNTM